MNWRSPQALFTSFMAVCVCGQLHGLRRSRQGRLPRARGSLKAFGAGLGCLRLMGIPSADFLHAGPSAAQPASERLQNRLPILRFGVFLTTVGGGTGLIVFQTGPDAMLETLSPDGVHRTMRRLALVASTKVPASVRR